MSLTKVKLSITVVFSAMMGYVITAPFISWSVFSLLLLGGLCITLASNALNQVIERDYDALMERTKNRPLPTGRMTVSFAVLVAGILSIVGLISLSFLGPIVVFLGACALLSYAFIYTPLKRSSSLAVFVGTIPGALPILIGAVVGEGYLSTTAWVLFAIQVLWQIPHFWAIGWLGFEEYKKAGYRFIPENGNGDQDPGIALQSVITALFLSVLVYPLFKLGYFSSVATVVSCIMGLGYAYFAYNLYVEQDRISARNLMFYSFLYLPGVLISGWAL